MKHRRIALSALAAFVFSLSAAVVAGTPPVDPCQECTDKYQRCQEVPHPGDCDGPYFYCQLKAGCLLKSDAAT
ncbi:hypothetical protein J5226_18110 [Lysobacter sp. K5869]|uniref:hypothetical protein n=1 Tax=Lysobacter sp. K5869 TaxID=2820808 RepID=UPI001C05F727|nr:hypothetical protein [Lysobacter sp. K5869]QWP75512.1 hypothetical protein J5226_18110 [Lysobacter sp. K5869]